MLCGLLTRGIMIVFTVSLEEGSEAVCIDKRPAEIYSLHDLMLIGVGSLLGSHDIWLFNDAQVM
ncbi:hypothetical protein PFISCL1PPCAC_20784, partial [Pristionchus fissidentatus]